MIAIFNKIKKRKKPNTDYVAKKISPKNVE